MSTMVPEASSAAGANPASRNAASTSPMGAWTPRRSVQQTHVESFDGVAATA